MDNKKIANYIFAGCVLIGVGLGMYMKNPAVGALVGVGLGFIIKAVYLQRNR